MAAKWQSTNCPSPDVRSFDIRVDARWEGYCHRQTGLTVAAFLVCQRARDLTRFGGLLVVRQFRDERNGTLSLAHGFPNGYAGLLNHTFQVSLGRRALR
jgi:hypothetical protein